VGPGAVGVTRADFLTPPEFAGLGHASDPAGRVGGARVELVRAGDETRLGHCYQQIPVRVLPPFPLDGEPAALLYLINLTAGLLDGDAHLYEMTARAGTRAVVTGQSASRVHPALGSFATQQWHVRVEDDACLVVLPGPAIPYRGCRYYQRARAELAPTAKFIWGDVWLPGRYDRGELSERFAFDRIVQDFEARRGGRLVYRDRFRWDGPWPAAEADWHFGGQLCAGGLFVGGPLPDALPDAPAGVRRAAFRLGTGENCLRWVGPPGPVTADLVRVAMTTAGGWTAGRPWLLESSDLAPNHWFSPPPGVVVS
jgi:urease accessory protein